MATIVTRAGKGSALEHTEMDSNFSNLNSDKIELTDISVTTDSASSGGALSYNNTTGVLTFTPAVPGTATTINNNADNRVITGSGTANTLEGEANFTYDGTTVSITNTSTDDSLLITTTEDTSTAAPVLTFKRNSASPANGDYLGQLKFKGENDADQEVVYAKITGKISDVTDTTEDGLIEFALRKAGSNNIGARLTSTDLKLINDTNLVVETAPTFTESSTPVQLTGTQPSQGGYHGHITVDTGTSRGAYTYSSRTAGANIDRHIWFFDLDNDFSARPSGAFQGDNNIWFQSNWSADRVDLFFDGYSTAGISAYGHGGNSYALQALELNGNDLILKGDNNLVATVSGTAMTMSKPIDLNGSNLTMGGGQIDLENGSLVNTLGNITFADNLEVNIDSAGTNTITSVNGSSTGIGIRSTVGTGGTAHTSGTAFLARRATSTGFQDLLKVESTGTGVGEGIVTLNNLDAIPNQDTVTTGSGTFTLEEYMEVVINGNQRYIPLYSRA